MSLSQYLLKDELSRNEPLEDCFQTMKSDIESMEYNDGLEQTLKEMKRIKDQLGDFRGQEFVSFGFE